MILILLTMYPQEFNPCLDQFTMPVWYLFCFLGCQVFYILNDIFTHISGLGKKIQGTVISLLQPGLIVRGNY